MALKGFQRKGFDSVSNTHLDFRMHAINNIIEINIYFDWKNSMYNEYKYAYFIYFNRSFDAIADFYG